MTNLTSGSTYSIDRAGLVSSDGLLEIYRALALIVDTNEGEKHHTIHNIFNHLFHKIDVSDSINHPEAIDFLSGIRMIMEDKHINTLEELDNYIHESKHKFQGKVFCNISR